MELVDCHRFAAFHPCFFHIDASIQKMQTMIKAIFQITYLLIVGANWEVSLQVNQMLAGLPPKYLVSKLWLLVTYRSSSLAFGIMTAT